MKKKYTLEALFKDYTGEMPPHREVDFGEDVGRERIWSMTDEEYEKEYGHERKSNEKLGYIVTENKEITNS